MDAARPVVSIVTPSFQQGSYLGACIGSVLGQDYHPLEYQVLDGGSTDGSVEILRRQGGSFSWCSEPDGGQAAAINTGLRRARGEVVGFVNSDDCLLPGAVASAVRVLTENPGIDVVYGRGLVIDSEGKRLRPFPTQAFQPEVFVEHCFICQPAAFWRRALHDRFGYFSTEFGHTLDYEFWLRLMRGGVRFMHVEEEWACARDHGAAKSRRLRGEIFREIRDFQLRHLGYCGRNWWEQHLRYLRDEKGGVWRLLPGKEGERLYGLAWWPYVLWRRKLGGPLRYRPGHWRV